MKRLLPAYLLLAAAAVACDSPSGAGPSVEHVVVTPAERSLSAGESVQLNAIARDERSQLVSNVEFAWTSLEQDVATVTQTGMVTGVAHRRRAHRGTRPRGRRTRPSITVFGSAAECEAPGAGISLAVGQSVQRAGAAGSLLCLEGTASGAEFTVIPFYASTRLGRQPGAAGQRRRAHDGRRGRPARRWRPPWRAGWSGPGGGAACGRRLPHAAQRGHARAAAPPGGRGARGVPRRAGRRGAAVDVGERAGGGLAAHAEQEPGRVRGAHNRIGRVAAVSQRAVVVADTANPPGGLTDADYQHVAATFDSLVYPVNVATFGEPADVDQNGRVIIFYTRVVNELTPRSVDYIVGRLLLRARPVPPHAGPATGFDRGCPGQQLRRDVLHAGGGPHRRGERQHAQRAVCAREHHRHGGARVPAPDQRVAPAVRRPRGERHNLDEEVYLNEGLSHIAEELLFYHRAQLAPRQNLGNSILAAGTATRAAFLEFGQQNEARYGEYLREPRDQLAVRGRRRPGRARRRLGVPALRWRTSAPATTGSCGTAW